MVCPDQAKTEVGTLVGSAPAARLKVGGKLLGHVMPNMMPVHFYHIGQTRDTGREGEGERERERQRACVCVYVYVYVNHDVQAYIQVKQHPHYRF